MTPTYTPAQIADAIARAKASTGWPVNMLLHDMAGHILAGAQASDEAIERASEQVAEWLARAHVEGGA